MDSQKTNTMIKNLTVLLTTFNDGKYIASAVNSILQQSFRDFELLIIDDGSTDSTAGIIDSIKDSRIRYIKREHAGFSAAQNFGLRNAACDWVAKMDADDISHPDRLKLQLRNLNDENSCSVITSNAAYFKAGKIKFKTQFPADSCEFHLKMALHSQICHPSVLYNRHFILENGGYDESLKVYEDYDLWLRILKKAVFCVVPDYLLFIRLRENSLSSRNKILDRKIIYTLQEKYYQDFSTSFGYADAAGEIKYRAWREYFFGEKYRARIEWRKIISDWDFRIFIAYLTTFLSNEQLHSLREKRLRLSFSHFFDQDRNDHKLQEIIAKISEKSS